MRVLHVDTARSWRGGQNQVLLTAKGMAARGHDVALACACRGVLADRARAAGLRVRELPFRGDVSPLALLGLRAAVKEERPDVLQLHDPHALLPGLFARDAASSPRLFATRRVDFPLRGLLSRLKYRRVERVVAVSRCIARVLESGGLSPDRIRVVYEGVPDRPPEPGGREALCELGVPQHSLVVGNVAALTDHKDHVTLLRAAALVVRQIPGARFVIVGEGERRGLLEARAHELQLDRHCVFAGFRNDLDRLIPAMDVFCLSSRTEGLGTSLLDAMAFARPVVATAAGGIPEAILDGVNGRLAPVRDHEALARALVEVLGDAERRARLGAEGRRIFEQRFTAERMVTETLRVFEELS